jgi:hypothetical protein
VTLTNNETYPKYEDYISTCTGKNEDYISICTGKYEDYIRFHYGSKVPAVTITVFITILEQNR